MILHQKWNFGRAIQDYIQQKADKLDLVRRSVYTLSVQDAIFDKAENRIYRQLHSQCTTALVRQFNEYVKTQLKWGL